MINLSCSLGASHIAFGMFVFQLPNMSVGLDFFSTVNFCDFEFSPSRAMYLQITGAAREREREEEAFLGYEVPPGVV